MRIPALLAGCVCLFLGGLAAGCGTHKTSGTPKTTRTGWELVTIGGRTMLVKPIGSTTLTLTATP
jgi:hypothetical protein